ncbi:tetraspanin-36 [Aplysia californica]|uniref:Tetraspanin n=1 Tax=Aplysia californica TaxID=6500 RepID=A0ABM0KB16_APLCA|nr:tetraspanin-36 [Aplysia californica]
MRTDQKLFCLKVVLTIFLILLWLVGAAIFGVLLWLRLDFWTNEYLEIDSSLERYLVLIYIALASGAVIVVFSILGLVGGCLRKKWLIVIYLAAICIAIVLTVSAVVYGIIYREELEETVVRDNLVKNIIQAKYVDDRTSRVRRAIDIMQSELECCGGNSPNDYLESTWALEGERKTQGLVPASCCTDYLRYNDPDQLCRIYLPDTSQTRSPDIWQRGCQDELKDFLDSYVVVVIAIGAVFFVLMLVCLIICSVYIHLLNSLYVPQPDDIVYDMAHNQEKSPYPSRGDYREYYH